MKMENFIHALNGAVDGRFKMQHTEDGLKLEEIRPGKLTDVKVFRLQKIPTLPKTTNPLQYWKTILVTVLKKDSELGNALQWAALAKDALLDPESADLYLFIIFEDNVNVPIETCIRIESTEQFCRKYVSRPGESPENLIERTFLAPLENLNENNNALFDPILKAFTFVEKEYSIFNTNEQNKWREAFLSGKNGSEIIDDLFI